MIQGNNSILFTHFVRVAMASFCLFVGGELAWSQGGGFGDGSQGGDGGTPVVDPTQDQGNTGGGTGDTGATPDGELDIADPIRLGLDIEDVRNQGFVGPTAPYTEENGFTGSPSTNNELGGLGENRFEGGGVNGGRGGRTATTNSRQLQENGFSVIRKSIRSRLRPAFAAPATPSFVTESRFQSRISRQPVVRNFATGVSISVANRTAVMTGRVGNVAQREIIKRQLRLEPGVYKIVDQTTIAN